MSVTYRKSTAGVIIPAASTMTTSVLSHTARVRGEKIQKLFIGIKRH